MMSAAFIYILVGIAAALGASQFLGIRFKRVAIVVATLLMVSQARHAYYDAVEVDHLRLCR